METYENSYSKNEDYTLWELHEIRHRLHEARKKESIKQINEEALKKFTEWKEERKRKMAMLKRA
jgi:hypothetical protein